jgi:hypothetical protein
MRGAPQSEFSTFIRRINTRSSVSICGRPPRTRLPTPVAAKTGPVPTHEGLGPDDCENLRIERNQRYSWIKSLAIIVREPAAATQPRPHDIQLMSKHRVLSLKPHLRLEWRGQHGLDETQEPDHSASLGDSIASSTRITFSVHTGGQTSTILNG